MQYCPKCNVNIEENFKFCPNCGNVLSEQRIDEQEEVGKEELICGYCGEENDLRSKSCSSCGANLDTAKTEIRQVSKPNSGANIAFEKKAVAKKNEKNKKTTKNKKQKIEQQTKNIGKAENREFDSKKIAVIFSGVLVLALLVLYFSGVLNNNVTKPETEENIENTNQQQGSGIDLTSLNRINQIDAQLKAEPNNFDLLLQLAHLKNDSGFKEEAITLYTKYLEKFPDNADVLVDRGVCYYELQQYDEAISSMEKAIKINSSHQIANMNLGIVNFAKGNTEKSKEWLQKAVKIDPTSEIGKKAKELLTSH